MKHDECEQIEKHYKRRSDHYRFDAMAYRNALIEACDGDMLKVSRLYQKHAEASALKKQSA